MSIAAVQMASTGSLEHNLAKTQDFIQQAADVGAQLVVFPEEFLTLGMTASERAAIAEPFDAGTLQSQLQQWAAAYSIWVVAGTLPIQGQDDKLLARCVVYDANGQVQGFYDKMHLFDVDVGDAPYRESAHFSSGEQVVVVDTPVGSMGLSICYDIRFPELYRALMKKGADFFICPAAFTVPTGQAHWEILLRARAIENLCYMVAPAQTGTRADNRPTFGHSMIISPWGEVIANAKDKEMLIIGELDLNEMQATRKRFPALSHPVLI